MMTLPCSVKVAFPPPAKNSGGKFRDPTTDDHNFIAHRAECIEHLD
jgi:hypothetical protein